MIKGIGIDLVEIKRIESIENLDHFIERICSIEEQDVLKQLAHQKRKIEFICGRFAAKEAYSKALGTGIGQVSFKDIVVLNDSKGKPYIKKEGPDQIHLSISHSKEYAIAQVIIESN